MNGQKTIKLIAILLILSLTSCDKWAGVNITKRSQMEKFQKKIKDFISPEIKVTEIQFSYADQRIPDVMGSVAITYFDPKDATQLKMRSIDLSENLKDWKILSDKKLKRKVSNKHISSISISDYNFLVIVDLINKATPELISRNLKNVGVRQFSIEFEGEPAQPVYQFTIDGRPEGSPITTVGRYSGIYYHEVQFTINSTGDWIINVDNKLKKKRGGL